MRTIRQQRAENAEQAIELTRLRADLELAQVTAGELTAELRLIGRDPGDIDTARRMAVLRKRARNARHDLGHARRTIARLARESVRPDTPDTGQPEPGQRTDPTRTRAFTLAVDAAWAEWENTRHGNDAGGSMHAALVAALPFVSQALRG